MISIIEGFFGKPGNKHVHGKTIQVSERLLDELKSKLAGRDHIESGEWDIIDSFLDHCIPVSSKKEFSVWLKYVFDDNTWNRSLNWMDVSKMTNFSGLFCNGGCYDISRWDTSCAVDMSYMFFRNRRFNCDISAWNVSNVTDMSGMFCCCGSFNQDLDSWDTSSVQRMDKMFSECGDFNGNVSNWDVSNVTTMTYMFARCVNFNQDISSWDVSHVAKASCMFAHCWSFSQDLSGWDVSHMADEGRGWSYLIMPGLPEEWPPMTRQQLPMKFQDNPKNDRMFQLMAEYNTGYKKICNII